MDVTYSKALAVIEDINRLFLSLEEDNSKSSVQKEGMKNESTIIAEISASLATLQKHHKDLTFLMGREMMGTKKDIAKGKVAKVQQDLETFREQFKKIKKRDEEKVLTKDRNELLENRKNPTFQKENEMRIMIDQEVYEQQFIQNSSQSLDQFISYGNTILGNLHEQKDTFTRSRKRLVDIGNTLGLSQHVIRLIERRTKQDTYVLIIGIIVTLIVMWIVIHYFT